MIRKIVIFLKAIRVVESALMTGFPMIGFIAALSPYAFTGTRELIGAAALFCFSTFFLVIYVYCLNSWGTMEADRLNLRLDAHPVLTGEMTERQLRFIAYAGLIVNLALYYAFFPRCMILAPLIGLNWTFYSHPKILAKAHPVAGTTIHFIGGILQVLLGYVAVTDFDLRGAAIAVYFSLVFSAGHLNHEVKDYKADMEAGLRTNAIVFGPRRMLQVAFLVFSFAFSYLLLITLMELMSWRESWPFLAIYPVHFMLHQKMMAAQSSALYDVAYQRNYRLLFVLAGLILLITKLTETF